MLENIYITILLVAALMFLDHFLTIKSVRLGRETYSKHVKLETYELNPIFRDSVNKLKYSWKHFIGVIFAVLITYFFYCLSINNILLFRMGNYYMFQGMILSILFL